MSKKCRALSSLSESPPPDTQHDDVSDDDGGEEHDESSEDGEYDEYTVEEEKSVTLMDRSTCVAEQVQRDPQSTLAYLCRTGKLDEMLRYYVICKANASTVHGLLSLSTTFSNTSLTSLTSLTSPSTSSSSSSSSSRGLHSLHSRSWVIQLPVDIWKRVILPMLSHTDILENLQCVDRTLFRWVQSTSWVRKIFLLFVPLSLSHTHTHIHTHSLTI